MTTFHPVYGEMYSPREVCEVTGFSNNQLRNWRIPARLDKAPFGYLKVGASPLYRKVVVDGWLEENGLTNQLYVPAGIDNKYPVEESLVADLEKQKRLSFLLRINTENQYFRWAQTLSDTLGASKYSEVLQPHVLRLYGMWKALSPEEIEQLVYAPRMVALKDPNKWEQYYVGSTLAHRRMWADVQGWNISDAEIVALPVGDYPPIKEHNK